MAHSALLHHVKLRRLVDRLGLPRPHVLGHWECLCHYVYTCHVDGDLSSLTDEEIEMAAEWSGQAGDLVAALIACRFLDRDEAGTRVHDYLEWCPDFARKRHQRWLERQGKRKSDTPQNKDLRQETAPNGAERRRTAPNGAERRPTERNGTERKRRNLSVSAPSSDDGPPHPGRAAASADGGSRVTDPQRAARALFDAMPAATRQEVADRLIAQAPGFRRGHLRSLRPEEVADHKLLRALLPAAVRDATQPTLDQGGSP